MFLFEPSAAAEGIFTSMSSNDWGVVFTVIGIALSTILAGIGSAIGVGKAGQAASGVVAERPERFGNCLVLELLPGSQGIFGFVISILILIFSGILGGDVADLTLQKGVSYLFASLPIAFGGLLSGIHQGKVAAAAIGMLGRRPDGFGNGMLLTLMVETYALLSLIVSVFLVLFA